MPPPIPDKIPCTTAAELERELEDIRPILGADETEDNWEKIARALQRFASITRGGAAKVDPEFIKALKELSRRITSAMCSERTRLSGTACDLLMTVAPRLSERFESIMPLFLPEVLKLCTRTNKLFISRGQKLLLTVISHTKLGSVVPYLREAVKDKSQSLRTVAAEGTLACIKELDSKTLRSKVEDIETIVRSTARDSHPEVRKLSKQIFEAYKKAFPERVDNFSDPLTPVTRRYLDIAPRDGASKLSQAPKANKPPAGPSNPRNPLSVSTSSAHPSTAKPPVHSRSVSTTALREVLHTSATVPMGLGQPIRPTPAPLQPDRTKDSSRSQALVKSVDGHSRGPSASSGSTSRPISALSTTAAAKPFAPARSMSENSKPQRLPQEPARPAKTASGSSTQAAARAERPAPAAAAMTGPQRTTISASLKAAVRPPLKGPPTAPAALHSSASRRQIVPSDLSKGPTPGKSMLQGGAKRIVSQPSKTGSTPSQPIRKKGFVPSRGSAKGPTIAGATTLTEKELLSKQASPESASDDHELNHAEEFGDAEDAQTPSDGVDNGMSPMDIIEEGSFVQDRDEDVAFIDDELRLEHLSFSSRHGLQTDDLLSMPPQVDEELQHDEGSKKPRDWDDAPPRNSSPMSTEEEQRTHDPPPNVVASSEPVPHAKKDHDAHSEVQRAARREEKRRLFEALSSEERDAIRQRKKEKKNRKVLEHLPSEQDDVKHAASIPLPGDEDESRKPSPMPYVDVPESHSPTIEIALEIAASIPLPEEDVFDLRELTPTPPLGTYAVVLPRPTTREVAVPSGTVDKADSGSSRSNTPEEFHSSGATTAPCPDTEAEEEEDALAGLEYRSGTIVLLATREGSPADGDVVDEKMTVAQLAAQKEKEKKDAAARLFVEMDVNVALSKA